MNCVKFKFFTFIASLYCSRGDSTKCPPALHTSPQKLPNILPNDTSIHKLIIVFKGVFRAGSFGGVVPKQGTFNLPNWIVRGYVIVAINTGCRAKQVANISQDEVVVSVLEQFFFCRENIIKSLTVSTATNS